MAWDLETEDFVICSRNGPVYHSGECHNKGFNRVVEYIKNEPQFKYIFEEDPAVVLRCEYMTKHKVPINEEFQGKCVIFDMEIPVVDASMSDDGELRYRYLSYEEYAWVRELCPDLLWLEAVAYQNPTIETLQELSKGDSQYCEYREGIVIKNYSFTNKFGNVKWGKVISPVFDEKKALKARAKLEVGELEQAFVDKYVTRGYVEKEIHKIRDEKGDVSTKDMGRIVGTVPYELFQDEMWRFLGKANAGEFNFRVWRALCITKVREHALNYFNSAVLTS